MDDNKLSLPNDDELRADLSALRYQFNQDGRIQIESKDECRKRLGRSPDRADAVVLAHWHSAEDHVSGWSSLGGHFVNLLTREEGPWNLNR